MTSPTLLGLPRELRDIIYDFLFGDFDIGRWPWALELLEEPSLWDRIFEQAHKVPFLGPLFFYRHPDDALEGTYSWVTGKIHNVPLLSVLLTCSRLHDEYT